MLWEDSRQTREVVEPHYTIFNVMLLTLLVLHIYWYVNDLLRLKVCQRMALSTLSLAMQSEYSDLLTLLRLHTGLTSLQESSFGRSRTGEKWKETYGKTMMRVCFTWDREERR